MGEDDEAFYVGNKVVKFHQKLSLRPDVRNYDGLIISHLFDFSFAPEVYLVGKVSDGVCPEVAQETL